MNELQRIAKLVEDLYDGSPWIGVTLNGTLKNITAQQAAQKVSSNHNSIWEIANHLISWRLNVLERLKGKVIDTPDHNYLEAISDTSETSWRNTMELLNDSQRHWINFLKKFN